MPFAGAIVAQHQRPLSPSAHRAAGSAKAKRHTAGKLTYSCGEREQVSKERLRVEQAPRGPADVQRDTTSAGSGRETCLLGGGHQRAGQGCAMGQKAAGWRPRQARQDDDAAAVCISLCEHEYEMTETGRLQGIHAGAGWRWCQASETARTARLWAEMQVGNASCLYGDMGCCGLLFGRRDATAARKEAGRRQTTIRRKNRRATREESHTSRTQDGGGGRIDAMPQACGGVHGVTRPSMTQIANAAVGPEDGSPTCTL